MSAELWSISPLLLLWRTLPPRSRIFALFSKRLPLPLLVSDNPLFVFCGYLGLFVGSHRGSVYNGSFIRFFNSFICWDDSHSRLLLSETFPFFHNFVGDIKVFFSPLTSPHYSFPLSHNSLFSIFERKNSSTSRESLQQVYTTHKWRRKWRKARMRASLKWVISGRPIRDTKIKGISPNQSISLVSTVTESENFYGQKSTNQKSGLLK